MFAFRTDSRRQRHTVWVMLAAWLFALTAAVINACVLNIPNTATRGLTADFSRVLADTEHHEGAPTTHHQHGQNGANHSCLKFCDDESSALSKGNTSYNPDAVAALVAVVQLPGAVVPVTRDGTGLSLRRPTVQGPPLVIRLLRLTL